MSIAFTTIGDWEKGVEIPLESAISVSMSVLNRTAESACRGLVAFMAQSASKLTKVSPVRRLVLANPRFRHVMRKKQYKQMRRAGKDLTPYYRHVAVKLTQGKGGGKSSSRLLFANTSDGKKRIGKIGKRALAKNSWRWRLSRGNRGYPHGYSPAGTLIESGDFSKLYKLHGGSQSQAGWMSGDGAEGGMGPGSIVTGFELVNALPYINKAMPQGWERQVERSAINRLLGTARNKLETDFKRSMSRASSQGRQAAMGAIRGALR